MRRLHRTMASTPSSRPLPIGREGQAASDLIKAKLLSDAPCMIARMGKSELDVVLPYWYRMTQGAAANAWRFVSGRQGPFWWDPKVRDGIRTLSGVFPTSNDDLTKFSRRMLDDLALVDVLGTWLPEEGELAPQLRSAEIIRLADIEPYYHADPWSSALAGRTVLVVHPFERSIREQYQKRHLLFSDPRVLPDFTLKTLKAVQSSRGHESDFGSWFEALDWMCARIADTAFDVAMIGAGAYGLPLAAFVKRLGRKAVHIGGATQILFGIRGRRWDEWPFFQKLYNEHWTRPLPEETATGPLPIVQYSEVSCYS
jgi:hypothetical protein